MTIRELYKWAEFNGLLDKEIIITDNYERIGVVADKGYGAGVVNLELGYEDCDREEKLPHFPLDF